MYSIPEDGQCDQNMKHVLVGLGKFVVVDEYIYQFLIPCIFGPQINAYQAGTVTPCNRMNFYDKSSIEHATLASSSVFNSGLLSHNESWFFSYLNLSFQ